MSPQMRAQTTSPNRLAVRNTAMLSLCFAAVLASATIAQASTLAYWRFEAGPAGAQVPSGTAGYSYQPSVPDSSGSGNELDIWDAGGAGFQYRTDVPGSLIPQTGAANNFSMRNSGAFPASFSDPTAAISNDTYAQWTIEASWKPENGGFRTVVGRDGDNVATLDGNLASLYLQAVPGDALAIKYTDEAGFFHQAVSAPGVVQGFNFGTDPNGLTGVWHNIAAVCDGTTLSLYVDKGTGYVLVAQTNLLLSGSPNTALTDGLNGAPGGADNPGVGGSWTAGDWTVGRGMYNAGHGDRAWGFIDEVRISNVALAQSQFLFVPAPAALPAGLALIGLVAVRRRRR